MSAVLNALDCISQAMLWVDKHRPATLARLDFHDELTDRLTRLVRARLLLCALCLTMVRRQSQRSCHTCCSTGHLGAGKRHASRHCCGSCLVAAWSGYGARACSWDRLAHLRSSRLPRSFVWSGAVSRCAALRVALCRSSALTLPRCADQLQQDGGGHHGGKQSSHHHQCRRRRAARPPGGAGDCEGNCAGRSGCHDGSGSEL